jgi:hypothetical protein
MVLLSCVHVLRKGALLADHSNFLRCWIIM